MTYAAERSLAYLYPIVIASSVICCVTSGIGWSHWRYALNGCPETNCGCYLYGRNTFRSFDGGHIAYCHYATYGLILPLLFCVSLGIYHVYRVCLGTGKRKSGTTTIRQRSGDMIVVTTESEITDNDVSPYYWMPTSVIACIMALYTLVYASIYTNGFDVTCKQYREALLKDIQGSGNIVPVIKGRLSCSAIFDFMDYLLQHDNFERRRYGRINSSICFHLTLIFAWVAVVGWIAIATVNIVQTRRTKAARV
ncbi:uncharacterized protein LOC106083780 [Stomoxys calcitrans]|uniref:Uncharacterized protein n=1 Tax=Stomoxys calcitrans TaxID=35570 RepID=A0A1I8Q554_STOCA|nr:uncharacterized protein LOC106083780 [Stomoxys calcitrans]